MFTGLAEETGKIKKISKGTASSVLEIQAKKVLEGTALGDSICVSGVCLSVTSFTTNSFTADVMHETLNRSILKDLKAGSIVNLERALTLSTRLGGHIVSGHVDGVSEILSITKDDNATWFEFSAEKNILKYIIEKGSVAIDGLSLTVAKLSHHSFSISAIPHTLAVTTLGTKKLGDKVNVEVDLIGKYVENLLKFDYSKQEPKKSVITAEFLQKYGF